MIVSNIDTAMKALTEQVDILKKKANGVIPVPMIVEKVRKDYNAVTDQIGGYEDA